MTQSDKTERTERELLPCPFCGSEAVYHAHKRAGKVAYQAGCPECEIVRGPGYEGKSEQSAKAATAKHWNTRTPHADTMRLDKSKLKTALETAKLFVIKHPNDLMAVPVTRVIDEAYASLSQHTGGKA